jgi:hypothetical protein
MNRLLSFRQAALAVVALTVLGLALRASASDAVPFRGHAEGVVTDVAPLSPTSVRLTADATGEATHLGRYTRTETVVLDLANGSLAGTVTFTAANGDLLRADAAGGFISPTTAVGTYTFTGGTGRFQNASGMVCFEAVTSDLVHVAITFAGTIEY